MFNTTIIPSICEQTHLLIGSISVSNNECEDTLRIYGLLTADAAYVHNDALEPDVAADFIDDSDNIVYHQVSTHYGLFAQTQFCTFCVEVHHASRYFDLRRLSEIRFYPVLRKRS